MYEMSEDFQVVILSNMSDPDTDDEIVQMMLDQIAHIDKWTKFYVTE